MIDDAMIALAGALGGGALRLLPEAVRLWRDHDQHDQAVELARVDLAKTCARFENAVELTKLRVTGTAEESRARMAAAHAEEMLLAAQQRTQTVDHHGSRLLDLLNQSVRPVVTYWLLAFYTAYKVIVMVDAIKQGIPVANLAPILRTADDVAIFSGAITYWFIDRTLARAPTGQEP